MKVTMYYSLSVRYHIYKKVVIRNSNKRYKNKSRTNHRQQ